MLKTTGANNDLAMACAAVDVWMPGIELYRWRLLHTVVLIHGRTPILAVVTFLPSPTVSDQLIGDHSVHKTMTEQQNRSITGKGL